MIREPEVVVGAQVDDVTLARVHHAALRAGEHPLGLVQALGAQAGELAAQCLDKRLIHEGNYSGARLAGSHLSPRRSPQSM